MPHWRHFLYFHLGLRSSICDILNPCRNSNLGCSSFKIQQTQKHFNSIHSQIFVHNNDLRISSADAFQDSILPKRIYTFNLVRCDCFLLYISSRDIIIWVYFLQIPFILFIIYYWFNIGEYFWVFCVLFNGFWRSFTLQRPFLDDYENYGCGTQYY
jgi:hypothetical protein